MTKHSRFIVIFLCGVVIWFGYICINSNQTVPVGSKDLGSNESDWSDQKLELEIKSLEATLEFMVWPKERLKILKQSISVTQELINRQPTNSEHWKRLLSYQYEYSIDPKSISWILDKIYKLEGWNNRVLINLSRYCVPFAFDNKHDTPFVCEKIIQNLLLQESASQLAHRIGISLEDLEIVMRHYLESQ